MKTRQEVVLGVEEVYVSFLLSIGIHKPTITELASFFSMLLVECGLVSWALRKACVEIEVKQAEFERAILSSPLKSSQVNYGCMHKLTNTYIGFNVFNPLGLEREEFQSECKSSGELFYAQDLGVANLDSLEESAQWES
ncbi:hypothetical protein PVK06_008316 [Gossypium arboreum]|uniref:Uncharacterized protein n=1 Tax=Gossypium arboreum TaxID=29729 RepID=A0ABR0QJU4_GOSAR|nr:hypothetical protein PVK06_008316 [Gossypium arboreum]